jgi:hypothetical protein
MDAARLIAAVAGAAAIAIGMRYAAAAIRSRHALDVAPDTASTIDVTTPHGDVLRIGEARFLITFADGTTAEVEADAWRSGSNLDEVVLVRRVIDLTGSHEAVVARYDHVKAVVRLDAG